MIRNQWYVVLATRDVRRGALFGVTRLGERLVFGRDEAGKVFCLRDRCAHRGAALSAGRLVGGRVQCPFHGFEYDRSGRGVLIPANGRGEPVPPRFQVPSYPTHESHGFVWIWWGENPPAGLEEPRFFEDIDDSLSSRLIVDPWSIHYSRAIENQLDVIHLPFVHRTTIGRGERTLVNGPVTLWKGTDRFLVHVFNDPDTGRKPLRPEEINPPYPDFHVEFQFPNLWQNWIARNMRIVVAFVPVDDTSTLMYLRFYQGFVSVPILAGGLNRLFMAFNKVVLRQDRRVVETQTPAASVLEQRDPGLRENLVQGDAPVIAYRTRRAELIAAAAAGTEAVRPVL
jgi:phenylpropionate dioxygenase-like ring-hydroxylating dioxygenase large terminal subunit